MQKNKLIIIFSVLLLFLSFRLTEVFAKSTEKNKTELNLKYSSDEEVSIRIFSQIKIQSLNLLFFTLVMVNFLVLYR